MQYTTNYNLKKPEGTDSANISDLNYNTEQIDTLLYGKQSKVTETALTDGSSITLADRTEYRGTGITTLTLAYPSGNFDCWLRFTTASSGTITITLPSSTYIGEAPDLSQTGKTFELSIKDGVVCGAEVGDGT